MENRKVKIGVLGAGRGMSMINFCKAAENVELVAVCDNFPPILDRAKQKDKSFTVMIVSGLLLSFGIFKQFLILFLN